MTIVKLKVRRTVWRRLPQADKPHYANNVFNQMDGQPAYAPIQAKVDALKLKSDALSTALDDLPSGGHNAVVTKNNAILALYEALDDVASELELRATDELYILRSGMELHKAPVSHRGELLPVYSFTVESNGLLGQAQLVFTCPPDQRRQVTTFAVEWSGDTKATWQNGTYENAERITVVDLPNRRDVYFKVRCLGTHGRKSQWSAAVDTFVL